MKAPVCDHRTGGRAPVSGPVAALCAVAALVACPGGEARDLSTEQLSRVVEASRPELKKCYDAALETHPYKQEIRLEAIIHIAPSGRVTGVELEGGGGLPGMADCLKATIRSWQFPEAQDPTHTSLPLIFQPEVVKTPQPEQVDTLKRALEQLGIETVNDPKPAP